MKRIAWVQRMEQVVRTIERGGGRDNQEWIVCRSVVGGVEEIELWGGFGGWD